ncbi:MAG TPA: LacI family DNA-binding transcriptional regulator [Chthoniobacteraceae bacterium]|nr:LacI family DNA-binding transcriptional regulator [Chthoniobacteraceae bacterium]
MKQHITLASLAQTLGLSRSTVSEILSGNDRYAEETVRRVRELAASLHYEPNRSAQATRRGRSNLIGVLHSGGPLQVANERAFHLGRAIAPTGYELLVGDWQWHTISSVLTLVRHMLASRVEGFIFSDAATFNHADTEAILALINSANLPAVILSAPHRPNIPAINADFETGFYDLTRHLLATGRRRLTLQLATAVEQGWHTALRYRGFCRAIEEAGGTLHPPLPVGEYRSRWKKGRGIQGEILIAGRTRQATFFSPYGDAIAAYEHLFTHRFTTDGIVASNDQWAAAIVNTAIRHGISIPERFAVTGFDNSHLAMLSPVPITSASQESEKTCELAVKTLLDRMRGDRQPASDILIPCPLALRASSAA